jgi:hypothetical protein
MRYQCIISLHPILHPEPVLEPVYGWCAGTQTPQDDITASYLASLLLHPILHPYLGLMHHLICNDAAKAR